MPAAGDIVLSVRDLEVAIPTRGGLVRVVRGIDLDVRAGQVTGIAGESGSGKTISMMAILGLVPAGSIVRGKACFRGENLLVASRAALESRRGKDIALVMQDPRSALHPMLSVGEQVTDHVRHHLRLSHRDARDRAITLLRKVRIPDPTGSFDAYPHQFSGGMLQRVSIAIALACDPSVLIADEPTTGLDVTVQAGILHLLRELGQQQQLAMILISHDLGVMATMADNLTVMYAGRVVEEGPTSTVLGSPRHPYTAALLDALPHPDRPEVPLLPIAGNLDSPNQWPTGCAFNPRCKYARRSCSTTVPQLVNVATSRFLACPIDPLAPAQ